MAGTIAPNIVTDGLVLYLDAANTKSYPGSGTAWSNIGTKGGTSTLVGGITFSNNNGGSMLLDGSNDTVLAPSVNTLGSLSNQTFEIWVKTPGLGAGKTIGGLICPDYGMTSHITSTGNISYNLYTTDSGSTPGFILSLATTGVNVFDNRWHQVTCTRENSGPGRIYIDGQLRAQSSNTGNWSGITIWSSMNTQIGNNPNDVFYNLSGSIASAKIYNVFLTGDQVLQNYNATKTRFGL